MKKCVFAIAAHPDDIEILMAGTMLLLRNVGWELHYWTLANGSCGTSEYPAEQIIAIRRDEAKAAANEMGAHFHESICNDLEVFYDKPTLVKVASVIREVSPDILLTHSPSDYMEDHTNTCRLTVTAAFSRGMPNFPVVPQRDPTHQDVVIYHAQPYSHHDALGKLVLPDMYIDVASVEQEKSQLLAKHVCQKKWLDESQGLNSYLDTQTELDAFAGRMSGQFEYAEGWRKHLHLGLCGPGHDFLSDALPKHLVSRHSNTET